MTDNLVDIDDNAQGAQSLDASAVNAQEINTGALETPNRVARCSRCHQPGHNARTCPGNVDNIRFQHDYTTRVRTKLDEDIRSLDLSH